MSRRTSPGTVSTINQRRGDTSTAAHKRVDEGKGRIKETAGSLTGNWGLKNEGHVDRGTASIKGTVDSLADRVKGLLGGNKKSR